MHASIPTYQMYVTLPESAENAFYRIFKRLTVSLYFVHSSTYIPDCIKVLTGVTG